MEKSLRALIIGFCISGILAVAKILGVEFMTWRIVSLPFLITLSLNLGVVIYCVMDNWEK